MTVPKWFSMLTTLDNGPENEKICLIEELSELTKEITKDFREKGHKKNVIEELADCYICMRNIEVIYDIDDDDVQAAINQKIGRYLSKRATGDTK